MDIKHRKNIGRRPIGKPGAVKLARELHLGQIAPEKLNPLCLLYVLMKLNVLLLFLQCLSMATA